MNKSKLEYIWLDGYTSPQPTLRSKTKIVEPTLVANLA